MARKSWRKIKQEAKNNYDESKCHYVYEVPFPEHVFIKISDRVVYDMNDKIYYKPATEDVDTLVSGYHMPIYMLKYTGR